MKWTRSSGGEKPTPVSQSQLEAIDQPTNLIEVSDKWISSDVMSSWSSSCNIVLSAVKSKSEKDLCKFLLRSLIQITLRLFVPCAPFLLSHLFLVVVCLACSFPSLKSFHLFALRFTVHIFRGFSEYPKDRNGRRRRRGRAVFVFHVWHNVWHMLHCHHFLCVILIFSHIPPQWRWKKSFWLFDKYYHHLYV